MEVNVRGSIHSKPKRFRLFYISLTCCITNRLVAKQKGKGESGALEWREVRMGEGGVGIGE